MTTPTSAMSPEMQALKQRLKATWMAGDYSHFAKFLEPGALETLARPGPQAGRAHARRRVRRGADRSFRGRARGHNDVDIATNLIARAREQARPKRDWQRVLTKAMPRACPRRGQHRSMS